MSKLIRVLHVFGSLDRGGAETMVMNLYRNLNKEKIQFDFLVHTETKGQYEDEIEKLGGQIFRLPQYKGYNHYQYVKKWHAFFLDHPEYNIIHGHVRSTASIYLSIAKKNNRVTISHSHSTSNGKGIQSIVKSILQYPIRYKADYFMGASINAGEWLFGKKIVKSSKFILFNNAIDAKKFKFDSNIREIKRRELGLTNELLIGHVGRFTDPKNHKFIIEVFEKLLNKHANSKLVLIGSGELEFKVKELVDTLDINKNVIFLGSRSDIPELMQAMDVFLFPSKFEGLGIVTIEAQASGLPTIVSEGIPKEAYITDLIKSINLNEDIEKWIEAVVRSFNRKERTNREEEIIAKGFDIRTNIEWLESFYLKINKN